MSDEHHCRVRSITDKRTGRRIEIFDNEAASRQVRAKLDRDWRYIKDRGWAKNIRGFALVIWDARGVPVTALLTDDGPISRGAASNFTKTALDDHVTRGFARDDVMDELFPKRPEGA